jgi:hypothetical protein
MPTGEDDDKSQAQRNSVVGGLALLFIRGVLLWVVVPLSTIVWVFGALGFRRRGVTLAHFLGWVDLNLIACLQRTVLRPFFRSPVPWVPGNAMPQVTHRLLWADPA